ncbi:DUF2799 domain-containing protein [Marinomonas agarivorans]|nr:DUF2799 domain-containing protein [Marinomonas agarivorans]
MKLFITLLVGSLVLSGCATLNKEECLTANWYQIGYEDGAEGYPETRIKSHREACAEHGIKPNFNDFKKGHSEGVQLFCKPRNGFAEGSRNRSYEGICPAELEADFLAAYQAGREVYTAKRAVSDAERSLRNNKKEVESLKKRIAEKKKVMLAQETTVATRYALDAEISEMQKSFGALEQQEKQLLVELNQAEADLRRLESKYAYY